ncbi:Voltage-gated sodium channel subunit [hydrothermal vent metagenome]|uniref:Voltage-gated sodium channel subunit n=1 Tax=hydrothermal vent metagenome TaxID=652676 RepID=A0A3B1EAB2_9ZZZZ
MYIKIKKIVENKYFQNFIISLIILNGITMGIETSKNISLNYNTFFNIFNIFVISSFTIEIILRIYVHKISFFKDPWSLFDFFIVSISLIPSSGGFEILRILRVLRLLRLITVVPQMRKIVMALVKVIPGMASIAGLLSLLFYIFAIISTQLYGENFPAWFGTLGESFYTLFQIMTLESWSMGIVRPVMDIYPLAWLFFVPFVLIATFIMINLIIAVVVDAMAELQNDEANIIEEIHTNEDHAKIEIIKLQNEIKELKKLILTKANV